MNGSSSAAGLEILYYTESGDDLDLIREEAPADWRFTTLVAGESSAERHEKLRRADVILHSEVKLLAPEIAAAERLKFVQRTGAGLDGLDVGALAERGIEVSISDAATVPVAEHAIMLMLAAGRRLGDIHFQVTGRAWPKWQFRPDVMGIEGRTVGIVGFGRIGQAVADRVLAMGAQVVVRRDSDRPLDERWTSRGVTTLADPADLFAGCDFISLHCPLTEQTRGFVSEELISVMQPHAILVNTARGALIDEEALASALRAGRIGGAGLDVLSIEPAPSDHPLIGIRNVIITPHVATSSKDIDLVRAREMVRKIAQQFESRTDHS